jgi:hypothetical protein
MSRTAALVLVLALLAAIFMPSATAAGDDGSATASWLAAQVRPDGSVLDPYTSEPSVDWSVNVALALATTSSQTEALDRAMGHVETNAEAYIISGTSDPAGHIAWLIILAAATGRDPRAFGPTSINLVDRLIARYGVTESGLFGTVDEYTPVTNQSLAIIALISAGEGVEEAAIDWLLSQQCDGPTGHSGAWQGHREIGLPGSLADCLTTSSTSYARPETGSTSYAVQALTAVRASGYSNSRLDEAVSAAVDWLRGMQSTSGAAIGGFGQYVGDPADPNSTALVILALVAAGVDPTTLAVDGEDPFSSLMSWVKLSSPDAGAASSPYSSGAADLFATFQVMWGISADPFPFAFLSSGIAERGEGVGDPTEIAPAYTG